jgi:hypothetical protein
MTFVCGADGDAGAVCAVHDFTGLSDNSETFVEVFAAVELSVPVNVGLADVMGLKAAVCAFPENGSESSGWDVVGCADHGIVKAGIGITPDQPACRLYRLKGLDTGITERSLRIDFCAFVLDDGMPDTGDGIQWLVIVACPGAKFALFLVTEIAEEVRHQA